MVLFKNELGDFFMENLDPIEVLHNLVISKNSSHFNSPSEYLTWFLEQVESLFSNEEEFTFANIQYFHFTNTHNNFLDNVRLKDIPCTF